MLRDAPRTSTYHRAISSTPGLFEGKVVLDVGCGTGVLAMFAAKAGAKEVVGIDASPDITALARRIVKDNGLDDVVTIHTTSLEEWTPPEEGWKCDVIVSEWMGYFLVYEGMLDTVLTARDRYLRPTGVMYPDKVRCFGVWDRGRLALVVRERRRPFSAPPCTPAAPSSPPPLPLHRLSPIPPSTNLSGLRATARGFFRPPAFHRARSGVACCRNSRFPVGFGERQAVGCALVRRRFSDVFFFGLFVVPLLSSSPPPPRLRPFSLSSSQFSSRSLL